MIVHIFPPAASFGAVRYNTNKIEKDKGELMKVSGFGPLQGLWELKPEDYKNYLQTVSALNKAVSLPQFHAVISAKGRICDKDALTEIAVEWLGTMGYGEQPYLIVFHKDTGNNHVHMVTTRIDKQGKKINSGFEHIRAVNNLNRILGIDEKHTVEADIAKALTYQFSTKAQFRMILESQGYTLKENEVIKFGIKQAEIDNDLVEEKIKIYKPDAERKMQLKAIFHKYSRIYDTTLKSNTIALPGGYHQKSNGFTSDFSAIVKEKLGLILVYHASGDKPAYGYTIIDNAGKMVFKGSEIMPLKELLEIPIGKFEFIEDDNHELNAELPEPEINAETRSYYAAILKAALYNYPDIVQGLHHQGLTIIHSGEDFILGDQGAQIFINIDELLSGDDYDRLVEVFSHAAELSDETEMQNIWIPGINIASDIDDEAVHGRNRRRIKKTSTNSR